jgi:hypothetical protein
VYVRVSGSVDVVQGAYTTSQLQALLLNGMSTFFNLPKEFITIIIMQSTTSIAKITTTPTPSGPALATTTPTPQNTSNSTRTDRRLLNLPTESIAFETVVQAGSASQLQQVQARSDALANQSSLLQEITGLDVSIRRVQSVAGFANRDGSAFDSCPDGEIPTTNKTTGLLDCGVYTTPAPEAPPEPQNSTVLIVTCLLVVFIFLGLGGVYNYDRIFNAYKKLKAKTTEKQRPQCASAPAPALEIHASFLQSFCRTANLQFPATVAIEYHLVPGQAI